MTYKTGTVNMYDWSGTAVPKAPGWTDYQNTARAEGVCGRQHGQK